MTSISMKKSEILRKVRALIAVDSTILYHVYICYALDCIARTHPPEVAAQCNELKEWIINYIRPYHTAIQWVLGEKGYTFLSPEEYKAYRLAWISDMIVYWESQND